MKKRWWILILVIVLIGGGVFIRGRIGAKLAQSPAANFKINDPKMVMTVEKGELLKKVSASGNLQPVQEKDIYFSLNGKVAQVLVAEGERVTAGQELARLEKNQQELAFVRAKSSYDAAKIKGSTSDVMEQELNLRIAQENLEATTLTAPISGLVTDFPVEKGDQVNTSKTVARLMDDSSYEIEVNIDEVDSHLIAVGQQVRISLDAVPNQRFQGQVSEIAYRTEMSNGVVTLPVTVTLNKTDPAFKAGYSTDLEIIVAKEEGKLVVPITAVYSIEGTEHVVKVVDGKPVPTPGTTGVNNGVQVAIEEGLAVSDQILINSFRFTETYGAKDLKMRMGPGRPPRGGS